MIEAFQAPLFPAYFEWAHPQATGLRVETRWPFVDLRVLSFAVRLHPFPWCVSKHLVRRAVQTSLPIEVLERPKTALGRDPLAAFVAAHGLPQWRESAGQWFDSRRWMAAARRASPRLDTHSLWALFRPPLLEACLPQTSG